MIPRTLSQSNLILSKKKDKTYNNTSFSKTKINNEEFSHKPTLNNLSIKIASQLEPSSSRLLRKKSHSRYMSTLSKSMSNMENDFIINDIIRDVNDDMLVLFEERSEINNNYKSTKALRFTKEMIEKTNLVDLFNVYEDKFTIV